MMIIKLKQTALALAIGAMAASAQAAPWSAPWSGYLQTSNGDDNHDGKVGPLSGMDLMSNGSAAFFCDTPGGCAGGAVAQGAQINPLALGQVDSGDYVLAYYQGIVSGFNGAPAPNLYYPGATTTEPYQITLAAVFREKVVNHFTDGFSFSSTLLNTLSGQFGYYYDDNPATFANISAGTGYTDGLELLKGFLNGGTTNYTVLSPIGLASGSTNIYGKVLSAAIGEDNASPAADVVGFMPDAPDGISAASSIQYGLYAPGTEYKTVSFFDNANGWTSKTVDSDWTVRADASADFTIPEPTTPALLGLGLAGLGLSLRRRAA